MTKPRVTITPALIAAMRERVVLGWTYRRVGEALGVSHGTVLAYARDVARRKRMATTEGLKPGETTFSAFRHKHRLGSSILIHAYQRGAFGSHLARVNGRLSRVAREQDLEAFLSKNKGKKGT